MRTDHGTVMRSAGHCDFEFARQITEFRMGGRPLPQHFADRTRIVIFISGHTGKMIGRYIADAIATRLDAMHADIGKQIQNFRYITQFRPIELQILPRGKMAITMIIPFTDQRQLA